MNELLDTITTLSHEFGTDLYVKGGGGNTSAKNSDTLWVKPSGTSLAALTPERFVALNRRKIDILYQTPTPAAAGARETLVKDLMAAAVENEAGRPSVEAPLHNALEAPFVVHTHPALVNGMTCAVNGEAYCKETFPEALWVEYIDPGYTLCMDVRQRIQDYARRHGRQPAVLMLKNHGIFISGQDAAGIHAHYRHIMSTLATTCRTAGIADTLPVADAPTDLETEARIKLCFGDDAAFIESCGPFEVAPGPLTPDHLVYARAFPFTAPLTAEHAAGYRRQRGYAPKVVVAGHRVYGIGTTPENARLALELARDAALVVQWSQAFGGPEWMADRAREFIENWEVEAYRQSVAAG